MSDLERVRNAFYGILFNAFMFLIICISCDISEHHLNYITNNRIRNAFPDVIDFVMVL